MASARTTAANPASLPSLRQAGIKTTLSVAAASGASLAAIEPSTAASARAAVPELHAVPLAHQSAKTPVTASSLRRFFPAAQSSVVITPMSAPTFATSDSEPTGRRVSLDFVDADISEVIKALAVQSGINVILATGGAPTGAIQNRITVSLHHVSFAEALDTVVNLSGYRYARIGSNYAVGTPEAVSALARGASTGPSVNDSIPFIFADGQSLLNSILSSFPNLRGRVTLISIGTEGRQGSSLYTVGQNSPASGGAPTGTNPTVPPGGPVQQQTGAPAPAGELDRVVPKGGVINISGTQAEIDAARALVEQTESALVDAPYQEQLRQSKRFAGLTNEVYKIKYASATELMAILARLVPNVYVTPGPSQAFSPKTTGQSVTFTGSAIPGLGGDAGGGGPVQNTSGPANSSITVTSATTTLILTGQPETLARARDVLDKVDIRLPQVVYEAKVVDINSQYGKKLGITYDPTRAVQIGEAQVGVSPIKDGATTGTPISMGPQASQDLARTPNFGAIYRTPYTVQMQLQAAVNDNKAKVLSNPNLTALDGQTATAFIGDQVKYITNITQTQQGQNVATETATVGITLKVTGRTSPDGTITLYVHPEVSSITSFLNAGNGIQLPQISTRFVDTTIRVKDGETIAIGGLISDTDSKNMQKVPVLGDIPFFGELFRFRQDQHNKDEVVVFITTHVNNN